MSINQTKFKQTEIGPIPEDWRTLKLGYICHIKYGKGLPERERTVGNYPVYGSNGIVYWHERPLISGPGIVIGRKGSIGTVTFSKHDYWPIDTTFFIEPPEKGALDLNFLYYQLKHANLQQLGGTDSAIPGLNRDALANHDLIVPPIAEQQKIAEVLGVLDDKIELNRKMNKALESIGQAIFKRWFLNDSKGMHGRVDDIVEIFDSKRIPLSSMEREKRKGEIPYYGATSVMDYVDGYIFDGTYLLLGEDGSVAKEDGKPFTQYVWGKIWVNNHAHVLRGKNGFSTELLKIFFDNIDIQPYVTGAVQPKLNQENMKNIPVNIPNDETLEKINQTIKPLFEQMKNNLMQIETLSQIRDSLLPRLMSGKLRVK